jgi:hypothetical protein
LVNNRWVFVKVCEKALDQLLMKALDVIGFMKRDEALFVYGFVLAL